MERKTFYKLIDEDVQIVAEDVLGRRLNQAEITSIKSTVEEKINWFDAIEYAIHEVIPRGEEVV